MSGRRLLDVAAIFRASRDIAAKHGALRKSQLDTYSKTSSLAQAVNSQTDRLTLTLRAASALSQRLNETGSHFSAKASSSDPSSEQPPLRKEGKGTVNEASLRQRKGLEQDRFYQRSESNSVTESAPNDALKPKQEKAKTEPLPDGTLSPVSTSNGTFENSKRALKST